LDAAIGQVNTKKTKKKTFAGLIRRAATKLGLLYGNKRN